MLNSSCSSQITERSQGSPRVWVRGAVRLARLGAFFARALFEGITKSLWHRGRFDGAARALWLQKLCAQGRDILGIEISVHGPIPLRGMIVSNHLSYLDIVVLGSIMPLAFLSKREVKAWPIVGWITELAGTLFITREDPKEVVRLSEEFEKLVKKGILVALFPEGTSSDGSRVLPFHSALLEPAVAQHWTVHPTRIGYSIRDGRVGEDVCYWGEMTFLPHLLKLVTKEKIKAEVRFGGPTAAGDCRKLLAKKLRQRVCDLGEQPAAAGVKIEQPKTEVAASLASGEVQVWMK